LLELFCSFFQDIPVNSSCHTFHTNIDSDIQQATFTSGRCFVLVEIGLTWLEVREACKQCVERGKLLGLVPDIDRKPYHALVLKHT
jgi:hypothetical protein